MSGNHLFLPLDKALAEIMRDLIWRLVLKDPQHSQNPDCGALRLFLANVNPVLCVNFRQHITEDLQKLVAVQSIERNQIEVSVVGMLVQLPNEKFHLLAHDVDESR